MSVLSKVKVWVGDHKVEFSILLTFCLVSVFAVQGIVGGVEGEGSEEDENFDINSVVKHPDGEEADLMTHAVSVNYRGVNDFAASRSLRFELTNPYPDPYTITIKVEEWDFEAGNVYGTEVMNLGANSTETVDLDIVYDVDSDLMNEFRYKEDLDIIIEAENDDGYFYDNLILEEEYTAHVVDFFHEDAEVWREEDWLEGEPSDWIDISTGGHDPIEYDFADYKVKGFYSMGCEHYGETWLQLSFDFDIDIDGYLYFWYNAVDGYLSPLEYVEVGGDFILEYESSIPNTPEEWNMLVFPLNGSTSAELQFGDSCNSRFDYFRVLEYGS